MCAPDTSGVGKHCQISHAYTGSFCLMDTDCRPHEKCTIASPYGGTMETAECRARCGPDLPCQHRGGVPHVCLGLDPGAPTCFPGEFFIPCQQDGDCVGNLKCLDAPYLGEKGEPLRGRRCSASCNTDEDCRAQLYTEGHGFCDGGTCSRKRAGGPCDRDAQCDNTTPHCALSPVPAEREMGLKRCGQ
jgi:hypothetical protein